MSDEPGEPVEDGDGGVSSVDAVADGGTSRGVHAPCGGADVHDCDAELFFFGEGNVEGGGGDGGCVIGIEVFLEFRVAKFHCSTEIFLADRVGDFMRLSSAHSGGGGGVWGGPI